MKYKLPAFLFSVILLAVVLVMISMNIYYSSGAFQLDLSRPEYKAVRSQIVPDKKVKNSFDSQGGISKETLDDFLSQYKESSDRLIKLKAFSNEVLSDDQLGM